MNEKRARLMGLLMIIVGIGIIGFAGYWFIFRNADSDQVAPPSGSDGFAIPGDTISGDGFSSDPDEERLIEGEEVSEIESNLTPEEERVFRPFFKASHVPVSGFYGRTREKEELVSVPSQVQVVTDTGEVITETVDNDELVTREYPVLIYNDYETGNIFEHEIDQILSLENITRRTGERIPNAHDWNYVYTETEPEVEYAFYRFFNTTFNEISSVSGSISVDAGAPQTCPYTLSGKFQLGDVGRPLEPIQLLLQYAIPTFDGVVSPGIFDEVMRDLVVAFQNSYELTADGIIGQGSHSKLREICIVREQEEYKKEREEKNEPPEVFANNFLPGNITAYDIHPVYGVVRVIEQGSNTNVVIETTDLDGFNKKTVLNNPYTEWLVSWIDSDNFALQTKSSGLAPSYLYEYIISEERLIKILGPQNGLSTLYNPTGNLIAMSTTDPEFNEVSFGVYDKATRTFTPLNIQTFPEKCAWENDFVLYCAVPRVLPNATYPDAWYQNAARTTDRLVVFDVSTGQLESFHSLTNEERNVELDVDLISVSEDKKMIYMRDKWSKEVWALYIDPITN